MAQSMLAIKDVSRLMGIGIHQAERLVKSSGFPCIRVGRRYLVPEDEFEKWIRNNCYSSMPYKLD